MSFQELSFIQGEDVPSGFFDWGIAEQMAHLLDLSKYRDITEKDFTKVKPWGGEDTILEFPNQPGGALIMSLNFRLGYAGLTRRLNDNK